MMKTFPSSYFSGQEWRKLRKLMTPGFSSSTLDVYSDVFKSNAEILVQTLKTKVGAGEFDVCPYLNLFTLDSIIGEYIECNLRNFQLIHSVFLSVNSYVIHKFCDKNETVPPLCCDRYARKVNTESVAQVCAVHSYAITYLCRG
jgi:hypothetical protein